MNKGLIIIVFSSLLVRELWTLVPYSHDVKSYFPFYEIKMTFQTYLYFPCQYVGNLMVISVMAYALRRFMILFTCLFILQVIEFVDYFFTYNTPWFELYGFDIGITVFRIVIMFFVTLYTLKK